MVFPANLNWWQTQPSQPISNKIKHNQNQEQHKNLNNPTRKTTKICTNLSESGSGPSKVPKAYTVGYGSSTRWHPDDLCSKHCIYLDNEVSWKTNKPWAVWEEGIDHSIVQGRIAVHEWYISQLQMLAEQTEDTRRQCPHLQHHHITANWLLWTQRVCWWETRSLPSLNTSRWW